MNILLAGQLGLWLDQTFANFDLSVFYAIGQHQSDFLTTVAKIFTAMGSVKYGILIGILGGVLCLFKKTRKVGLSLVFAMLLGIFFTNLIIKPIALRIRPYNTLQHDLRYWAYYIGAGQLCESDFSFPSGHTSGAFTVAIPLLLCHATSKKKGARAICWIFPIFAIATGLSRIYFMLHYATDVIGGAIVGIIAGIIGYAIGNAINNFLEERRLNDKYDAELLFKKGVSKGGFAATIIIAWLLIFSFSYLTSINDGGPNVIRCAYDGEYKCQNEAKVNSKKYPPIEGKEYCKYHWELIASGEIDPHATTTAEETTPEPTEPETVNTDPIPNSDLFTFLNDASMNSFRDNFDNDTPVKLETYWDDYRLATTTPETIRAHMDAMKGMQIGNPCSDNSSEGMKVTITFIMPDDTSIQFEFHGWYEGAEHPTIVWKGGIYEVSNTNGLFDIWIENDA